MARRIRLGRVSSLSPLAAAGLINTVFMDYPVVINETEAGFIHRRMSNDLQVDMSPVLLVDEKPVGLALVGMRGQRTWLGGMGITKEHRGKGYGRMLLEEALEEARRSGAAAMTLEVMEENTAARTLYKKAGFREVRTLYCLKRDSNFSHSRKVLENLESVPVKTLDSIYDPEHCWQKAFATISRIEYLEAYRFSRSGNGYVVLSRRNHKSEILDVSPPEALDGVLEALCRNTVEIRAINIHDTKLLEELAITGFTVFLKQQEMRLEMGT